MLNGHKASQRNVSRISWKQVAGFRLSRHHLSQRAPAVALTSVVEGMAGAQAQVLPAAQISIWARVRNLRVEDLETALWKDRVLTRAWCMRRTMYLVPSKNLAVFARGSAIRAEKETRWMLSKGVSEQSLRELVDAVLRALERPRTQSALAELVSKSLGLRLQFKQGGGWGSRRIVACVNIGGLACPASYLLYLVGERGVICSGPIQGNQSTFVRADRWIPQWKDIPVEKADRELLRRYLRAFGPATVSDFARWTGMRISDAEEIWSRESADIAEVNVEGWEAAILQSDLHELDKAKVDQLTVRLLPYFDSFLLGHKERRHLVEASNHNSVYRAQGWIYPVILVNGRAVGIWSHAKNKDNLSVRVKPFHPLSPQVLSRLRAEAADLGRFLECSNVETRVL